MNWQFTIDIETPDSGLVVAHELGEMLVSWLQITKLNGQIMGFNIETGLPPEKNQSPLKCPICQKVIGHEKAVKEHRRIKGH